MCTVFERKTTDFEPGKKLNLPQCYNPYLVNPQPTPLPHKIFLLARNYNLPVRVRLFEVREGLVS